MTGAIDKELLSLVMSRCLKQLELRPPGHCQSNAYAEAGIGIMYHLYGSVQNYQAWRIVLQRSANLACRPSSL
jgi:hypothetical protein